MCAHVREYALMMHSVNPCRFGMEFITLAHVTTYTRPMFYSMGGLGMRLSITCDYLVVLASASEADSSPMTAVQHSQI